MERVVIIGAGVMGCACAHRLAEAGLRVTLLEKSIPGAESSAAAAGILGAQSEVAGPGPFFELCLASRGRFRDYARELTALSGVSVGYEDAGVLEVALDPAEGRLSAARAEWMLERGLRVEILDRDQARALEPALTERMVGALYFPDDHWVDPVALSAALAAAAARLGAEFRSGDRVRAIEIEAGRVTGVKTEGGFLPADRVVVAGGAWSSEIPGLPRLRTTIRPVAGQIIQLESRPPRFRHVVYGYKGYVVPRADGRVLMGSTLEDRGFDKAVTLGGLHRVAGMALEMVPGLADARYASSWSGLRPATADNLPMLGASAVQGLFVAAGHYRNGILLTPITAEVIRDLVLGRAPAVDIDPFAP
ncbi:Glycine oxidase [Candidatus Magnetaquicoccaceae bacterium FCR-1]|uniref:Glycine oxidase n=1 Tax=Candidatus Magnetaquiglobus chichijimensis TaxID=3141448 RepID=A0ABQ0C9E7_9PROT